MTARAKSRDEKSRHTSLTSRIFWALLVVSVVGVVLAGVASTVVYQGSVQSDAQAQLERETDVLSQVINQEVSGAEGSTAADPGASAPASAAGANAEAFPREVAALQGLSLGDLRATLIAPDGSVLYDSDADAADLPNHADRPEVEDALATGSGSIVRPSTTLGNVSLYRAVRLDSGNVLRLSLDRAGIMALLRRDTGTLAVVALLLVGLSWVVAHLLSRRLVRPVINMYPALGTEPADSAGSELADSANSVNPAGSAGPDSLTASLRISGREVPSTQSSTSTNDKNSYGSANLSDGCGDSARPANGFATSAPTDAAPNPTSFSTVRVVPPYRELEPLTDRINSQQERLAAQMRQLQQANEMRSEFTANVTHELKTPLQSISGASELMCEGMVQPEDIPDFARRIYSEARRLTNLVNDILTLSKLDDIEKTGTSGYHEKSEPVDLFAVARDVEQRLEPRAEDVRIKLELAGGHATVLGLPRLLDELTYNLVDNAIRYNKPGGYVRMWVGSEAGCPTLRVSDSGIGIAPADQRKIFERFYRVEKSRSRASGGTGLGLAIVKHAATYHHATIDVSSELGKGSTFTVTFPREM